MRGEESLIVRVQRGVKRLLDPRNVDFRILHIGMVAVNEDSGEGYDQQKSQLFEGRVFQSLEIRQCC